MAEKASQQKTLGIHTHLTSEYQIFDRSGKLTFSITFGLCRRSPGDTDPRSLVFDIKGSALDVPYALASGLLKLCVQDADSRRPETEVDVSSLPLVEGKTAYIALPSPVNRRKPNGSKFAEFTTFAYRIDSDSDLAALFEAGKRYRISLASVDLGLKLYGYRDEESSPPFGGDGQHEQSLAETAETQYINSKPKSGSATFKVKNTLCWPPEIETHMRFCPDENAVLEFSFANTGSTPISVQCRGRQHYLTPSTLFTSEIPSEDSRPRIIDSLASPWSCLQIEDIQTNEVVHQPPTKRGVCGLYDTTVDRRIKLCDLITLMPGEPFVRRVDIGQKLATVPNGEYRMCLLARGVWWCAGIVEQIRDEGDDRVPRRLHKTTIPPVQLRSDDTVVFRVVDKKIVEQGT